MLSTELKKSFSEPEIDIIKAAKSLLPKIREWDNDDLKAEILFNLISVIHVITGWKLPDDAGYVKILCEELVLMLKEDFAMLNLSEVRLAFRKNRKVQDWGKSMNLNLISEVLGGYCEERTRIGNEERKLIETPTIQVIYDDEQIQNQRRSEFENAYQSMRKGYLPTIYDYYEELLVVDGIMDLGENLHEFISKQLNNKVESIYTNSI